MLKNDNSFVNMMFDIHLFHNLFKEDLSFCIAFNHLFCLHSTLINSPFQEISKTPLGLYTRSKGIHTRTQVLCVISQGMDTILEGIRITSPGIHLIPEEICITLEGICTRT